MRSIRFLSLVIVFTLPFYLLAGCKAGRPARATLPDQPDNSGFNENQLGSASKLPDNHTSQDMPFYAVDTTIEGKSFTAIYLRNPEFDSLAFGIVKSYEPFAKSLLKIVAEQGIKGVLIDFRQNDGDKKGEAKYAVDSHSGNEQGFNKTESLNVVFLWDESSASRAAGFINELNASQAIAVKNISSTSTTSTLYRQDCFRPGFADFDEQ